MFILKEGLWALVACKPFLSYFSNNENEELFCRLLAIGLASTVYKKLAVLSSKKNFFSVHTGFDVLLTLVMLNK